MHMSCADRRTLITGVTFTMTIRQRKLAGTIALLVFLAIYALLAMAAAIILQVNATKTVELLYYVTAGLLWVVPAGAIIKWMQKPDDTAT